jgi:hypothetical protein
MSRNPYAKYHVDEKIIKEGIWYEDEDVRIKVTYAGTENARYEKMLKLKLKPYQTRINSDNFSDEAFHKVLAEVYAATVVMAWEVKKFADEHDEFGTFVPGIYDKDGNIVEFNEENITMAFGAGQRLFSDIIKMATNFNLFRQGQKDADIKK